MVSWFSILHEKDLDKLEVYELVNKIWAHEMSTHEKIQETYP